MKALAHGNAMLQEEAADLIDYRGPVPNQSVAHAMQRLKIELFVGLYRHTQRRWTLHGFSDCERISKVILLVLSEGLGVDRWNLPYIMANGEEITAHIVCSHACLNPDKAARHIRKPGHNSIACHLLAQNDCPSCVEPNQVQRILA